MDGSPSVCVLSPVLDVLRHGCVSDLREVFAFFSHHLACDLLHMGQYIGFDRAFERFIVGR